MLGTEPQTSKPSQVDDATIAALAKQTRLPHDVVKQIYDEEIAALHSNAKIKRFVGVIVGRRVKRRLKALKSSQH